MLNNTEGFEFSTSPNSGDNDSRCILDWDDTSLILEVSVLGLICLFSLVCNSFALLVFHRIRDMHDVTKLLLVTLTITDVGVGFFGLLSASLELCTDARDIDEMAELFQHASLCILAMITVVR